MVVVAVVELLDHLDLLLFLLELELMVVDPVLLVILLVGLLFR
jgi:hypothetical protein